MSQVQRLLAILRNRWFAAAVVLVVCLYGAYLYLGVLSKVYPVDTWLFWRLATLWGWMAVLSLACLSVGSLVLERVIRLELPPLEAVVQSMALGLVCFVMCMYLGGAVGLFGPVFAVALPALLVAGGAKSLIKLAGRFLDDLREPQAQNPFVWLISGLGAFCVVLAYLQAMTPDSLNYDSTWSHLVIAQDYARHGRIFKFLANWNMGVPHLASLVHTWGWTVPGLPHPALRWMMALHNEFGLFCWTLVGIAAGTRRLLGEPKLRGSWAGFFLFPIIFVYDNNMGGAADHIAAFFIPPFLLAFCELWERMSPRAAALLAASAAGAMLTKYQAAYLFPPLALLLLGRWGLLAYRVRKAGLRPEDPQLTWKELLRTPLVLAGVGALLVSPHFIKNAIFYHNPLYPFAQETFKGTTPSSPNNLVLFQYIFTDDNWKPKGGSLERLWHAIKLFFNFAWTPHYSFTRDVPAFGALFTLLLPTLLVLRGAGRIWLATAVSGGALFLWAYTYNLDRNLQIFLPIMVCVTVALMVRLWRLGWLARAGLVPLVLLQVAWGGDALFYSSTDRMQSAMSLIRSGFDGRAAHRLDGYRSPFVAVRDALPPDAVVVLHTSHITLGIDRDVLQDWDMTQGYINYASLQSAREIYEYLRARGVTHLLTEPHARGAPTKQTEVLFNELLSSYAQPVRGSFGHFRLFKFPKTAPPLEAPYQVVMIGVGRYQSGRYPIKKLDANEYLPAYKQVYQAPDEALPADSRARAAMLEHADAVFVSTAARLDGAADEVLKRQFSSVIRYEGYFTLYLKGKGRRSL